MSGTKQSGNPQTTVAKILAEPVGQWLVGMGGLAFVAVGLGRAGLSARGVVFPIIGFF